MKVPSAWLGVVKSKKKNRRGMSVSAADELDRARTSVLKGNNEGKGGRRHYHRGVRKTCVGGVF